MPIHDDTFDCNARSQIVLDYAARGWSVFPLRPNAKEPATKSGFYDATANPATLRRYFRFYPYNVGIRTGIASKIFVVDVDGHAGAVSLAELEAQNGPLPGTLISTGNSGFHLWFYTEQPIPCSVSKIGPGIDVRGDGGYAVAPPSIHPDGPSYKWRNSLSPVPAPAWLLELISKRPPPPAAAASPRPQRTNGEPGVYGAAALEREIGDVARAAPGARDQDDRVTWPRVPGDGRG